MAISLHFASDALAGWLAPASPLLWQLLALCALVALAMAVYFSVAFLIGGADLGMIRRNMKRKAKTVPGDGSAE